VRKPGSIGRAQRPFLCTLAMLATMAALPEAQASSHREAPFITTQPKVDGTDFYMFRSYEPGRTAYTTIIADYAPLQNPGDGPNYYTMDAAALYEIHIDQNADAVEDLTFQFQFQNTLKDITLPVGGKNVSIPLMQAGVLTGTSNPANLNVRETYTLAMVVNGRRSGVRTLMTNLADGSTTFEKPVDYIGDKSFGGAGNYAAYANAHIYSFNIPNCTAGAARVFVGQRKDPFALALGQIFDLINLNPLGSTTGNTDYLANKNVTSLELEIPTACLTNGTNPIIGGWTTASMRQGRLLSANPASGYANVPKQGGAWVQVSRLGMPLVNEVVIGLKDKDKFNGSKPGGDGQFIDYVTNPTLPALIQILFSAPAPTNFPRTDLVAAFLTGIAGVNKPAGVVASEMLRLNTSIAPTAMGSQNTLGVLAGDNAGFPNGRRPGDDVVDASLRVAMGALCVATGATDALQVGCRPSDAPAGSAALTDGTPQNAAMFQNVFPYLNTPLRGSP